MSRRAPSVGFADTSPARGGGQNEQRTSTPPLCNGGGAAAEGALVAAIARTWLGTPYQHQQSLRLVACDCLGLVRGVWRALYGAEPEAPPPYRADWAETSGRERLLEAARRRLVEIDLAEAHPGDVLLFRFNV